jgi:energy-coupling factor transporter ATP-binding protein EcfA2
MYLSRFGVKNYKCLGDIDIPLTPIHVLIGQNDCGKTSLLEAMAAFFGTIEKEPEDIFPEPWIGRELVRHGTQATHVEFWGEWSSIGSDGSPSPRPRWGYGISVEFPSAKSQSCQVRPNWVEANGERHSLGPGESARVSDHSGLENDLFEIGELLKPAHQYALDAKQMVLPAGFDPLRKFRLDADGFGLATLLDDIVSFDPKVFLDIQGEFCRLFPQFQSVRVPTEYGIERTIKDGLPESLPTNGKGVHLVMRSGQDVRARHASDGAILFLGLLALSHLPEPPRLLLLEEPENGVYPMRLGQILTLLKEMANRTTDRFPQIVLTTHSPYVLSLFQPEEVTFLSRGTEEPDAPVRARPLRDAPNIRERLGNDFYLGELWYNLSEGELFGDVPCQSRD